MSDRKFTPGPWSADLGHEPYEIDAISRTNGKKIIVADIPNELPESEGDATGDAYLIAAAPELYEALKALYEETAEYITLNHLGDVHHNRSMQQARAALAKAEAPNE